MSGQHDVTIMTVTSHEHRAHMHRSCTLIANLRLAVCFIAVSLALSGCGLFGCAGVATNGGGAGGCSVGTRF
jgi:hypothetical protein